VRTIQFRRSVHRRVRRFHRLRESKQMDGLSPTRPTLLDLAFMMSQHGSRGFMHPRPLTGADSPTKLDGPRTHALLLSRRASVAELQTELE
jgi:hypothetical protein